MQREHAFGVGLLNVRFDEKIVRFGTQFFIYLAWADILHPDSS